MKNKKMKSLVAVLGLCLLLFVGCKTNEPNPANPSTPSQTGGTSEIMQEDVGSPEEGSIG